MMDHIKLIFDFKFVGSRCNVELLYESSLVEAEAFRFAENFLFLSK